MHSVSQNSICHISSATYLLCENCCTADHEDIDVSQNYIEDLGPGPAGKLAFRCVVSCRDFLCHAVYIACIPKHIRACMLHGICLLVSLAAFSFPQCCTHLQHLWRTVQPPVSVHGCFANMIKHMVQGVLQCLLQCLILRLPPWMVLV